VDEVARLGAGDRSDLFRSHARETLEDVMERSIILEILEQRRHLHARSPKHPSPAHSSGVALDGRT